MAHTLYTHDKEIDESYLVLAGPELVSWTISCDQSWNLPPAAENWFLKFWFDHGKFGKILRLILVQSFQKGAKRLDLTGLRNTNCEHQHCEVHPEQTDWSLTTAVQVPESYEKPCCFPKALGKAVGCAGYCVGLGAVVSFNRYAQNGVWACCNQACHSSEPGDQFCSPLWPLAQVWRVHSERWQGACSSKDLPSTACTGWDI